MKTTLTERGQTAIPSRIRKSLNLQPGQKLDWIIDGQAMYVMPLANDPIKSFRGSAKGGASLTKALLKSRAEDVRR